MEGGGWYGFAAPLPNAHTRLAGTLLLRPLQKLGVPPTTPTSLYSLCVSALMSVTGTRIFQSPQKSRFPRNAI